MSARSLSASCAVALACLAHATHGRDESGFSLDDDFARYRQGSDASPSWETGSIGWEVRSGAFTCDEPSKDFAFPEDAPLGREARVSAELTLRGTTASGWKVAGLCVRRDPRNYWHLALVEGPDESPDGRPKRHFVELTEMLDGRWLAQLQERTKLRQTSAEGQGFDWRYGRAYRLEVTLSPTGIVGAVTERDGTRRARIAYAFDPAGATRAVTHGRPGLVSGGFRSEFRRFSARAGDEVPEGRRREVRPPYASRGSREIRGEATGFFHVEERDGTWWMIDPHGNSFFGIGTDHVNYNVHWCEKLGHAPYHRSCERKYGSAGKWADSTVPRLLSWGFNCVGVNSSPEVRYRGLAHMTNLSMGTRFAERDPITPKTTWTGFPNVFSPKFRPFCEKLARRVCAPNREDPWLVGYFIDNELEWHAWTGGGPFVDSFAKPADHSAKRALVKFFKGRYAAPAGFAGFAGFASFNEAWGTKVASLDDLLGMTKAPAARTDAAKADVRAFVRLAADRYFAVTSAAIRKHDPNHMIMGCRFAGGAPDILDVAGRYCDVFSINCYRKVDLERGVMADGFEEQMRDWYARVERPFVVTEWSFPALDAGLPCKHGAGQRVPTQKDKAFAFTVFQKLLFSTRFIVGSNYFMWADEPELGISSTFPEDSNYGLVNVDDEPYELLSKAATAINGHVYAIHSGAVTGFGVEAGEGRGVFVVTNAGAAAGGCVVSIRSGEAEIRHRLRLASGASKKVALPRRVLREPGGHMLVCRVEPDEPLLDTSVADDTATRVIYNRGAPWHVGDAGAARVPVLVANPGRGHLVRVPVALEIGIMLGGRYADRTRFTLGDLAGDEAVPFQFDAPEGGVELAFEAGALAPWASKTFFLCGDVPAATDDRGPAVGYGERGRGFRVSNGALVLEMRDPDRGNAFDRVSLGDLELGSFRPLLWQVAGQNMWVGADRVEKVEAFEGPVRLVLEVTFARGTGAAGRDGGKTITEVDDEGRQAPRAGRERSFRTKYRFEILPDRKWFTSRLVWIENTDAEPMQLKGYYHYAPSNIGGDASDDEAQRDRWIDKAAGACYGVIPGSPEISVTFWKDKGGGEHPDAFRKLWITLAPGERYEKAEPVACVVGCREGEWDEVAREIASLRQVIVRAFAPERR